MDPTITLLEVHKLMYFMQEVGEPLRLRYPKAPYGPESDRLHAIADRARTELDFDTAIINYRRARDLAQTLGDRTLRLCGMAGAEARLQGTQAQKDYMHGQWPSPQVQMEGDRIFEMAFDRYWQQFNAQNPDLVNSCP
jgi:hypothetical protein